jgi:asparagine synthase (glutamine-hydrolysing)
MMSGHVVVIDGRVNGGVNRLSTGAEAIIAAYQRWGDECIAHVDGEFAFILWDANRRRIVAGSDVAGSHSLAYFFDGETFLVASRVLSLLRHPAVRPRWNRSYFAHVLGGFWAQPPGITAFDAIRRIRPGAALVLENGQLREHVVAAVSSHLLRLKTVEEAGEEFWNRLRRATSSRFDGPASTCLALSGGLDSTLVGASLSATTERLDAFSYISEARPDLDETPAIHAFCAQHPFVSWHPVACDADRGSRGPLEAPPLADDPLVTGDALRQPRMNLLAEIGAHGFHSVLDGEGGDELFSMSPRIGDFVARRHWMAFLGALRVLPRPRSTIWRGLVVPGLPRWGRTLWNRREQRRLGLNPPWMTTTFWHAEATREARELVNEWATVASSAAALPRMLAHPAYVGTRSAARLSAGFYGLEVRSPLLDRSLIEFALGLPPEFHWSSARTKPFLRVVGQGHLPPEVLDREKDVALYELLRFQRLAVPDLEATLAPVIASCEPFAGYVDVTIVLEQLRRLQRQMFAQDENIEHLYSLIASAHWTRAVAAEYRL